MLSCCWHDVSTLVISDLKVQMLAYLDIIAVLGIFCLVMVPLVWIVRKPKGGADAPAH